jgi:hypothetical protein
MELRPSLVAALLFAFAGCGGANPGAGSSGDGGSEGDGGIVATASCDDPATACGAFCVDLQNDPANCGDCDHACPAAHVEHALCLAGTCAYDSCATGFADCDGDEANGCELPITSDVMNCGGCGIVCAPDNASAAACNDGQCGHASCAAGFADCDGDAANGCEVTLADDDANCGACGNRCGGGTVCGGGSCGVACDGALTKCGSGAAAYCTLTDDDPDNCGSCGHSCTPLHADNKACAQGACGYHQCDTGWGDCDQDPANGCETCLVCSLENCGGCGITCNAVHTADLGCSTAGECVWSTCAAGWGDCDSSNANGCESDILNDDLHCGASCVTCDTGLHCNAGVCS